MSDKRSTQKRRLKKTLSIFCEGIDEKSFLEYLKMTFSRDSGVAIRIINCGGGSANCILTESIRRCGPGANICMYDLDTGAPSDILVQKADNLNIKRVESKPCFEAFLLSILDGIDYSTHTKCDKCKKEFESKYLNSKKRKQRENYTNIFPKALLEQKAKEIPNLKKIIDVMQGKF